MVRLVKIRLTFKAVEDINFPYYAGSALRGVFGKSLRRVSCLTPKTDCAVCAMAKNCPYATIFENGYTSKGKTNEDVPNPYVIEPMPLGKKFVKQGELFTFEQNVFGTAVEKLSYILLAWVKTGNLGFTKERSSAKLLRIEQVEDNGKVLLLHNLEDASEETETIKPNYELRVEKPLKCLKIVLETPLRIHHLGHPIVPNNLTAQDFLNSLMRKLTNMAKYHISDFEINNLEFQESIKSAKIQNADLRWLDWKRYSSRQKQEIGLGGIVGSFELVGNLTKLYPYLKVGEYFHCGKSTVMGLGKFCVIEHCE